MLGDDVDPMVAVMKLEKAPKETYADIGGLTSQIQEIKVGEGRCWTQFHRIYFSGSGRIAINSSRILRRNGYPTTKRCYSLW